MLNHRFELAIIEEVANGQSTAHLRNLDCSPCLLADVLESSMALVRKQQLGLKIPDVGLNAVHLWIHMSVDQEDIGPSILVKIDKGISPPHVPSCGPRNS